MSVYAGRKGNDGIGRTYVLLCRSYQLTQTQNAELCHLYMKSKLVHPIYFSLQRLHECLAVFPLHARSESEVVYQLNEILAARFQSLDHQPERKDIKRQGHEHLRRNHGPLRPLLLYHQCVYRYIILRDRRKTEFLGYRRRSRGLLPRWRWRQQWTYIRLRTSTESTLRGIFLCQAHFECIVVVVG